jgi:hypothetical protein
MVKEIEITKWIIRIDESRRGEGPKAQIIGLDKDGNEYTFQPRAYINGEWENVLIDITAHETSKVGLSEE